MKGNDWNEPSEELKKWTYWLDTIEQEASDRLTLWETGFIVSLREWLTHSKLTTRQAEVLERMYEKYTK